MLVCSITASRDASAALVCSITASWDASAALVCRERCRAPPNESIFQKKICFSAQASSAADVCRALRPELTDSLHTGHLAAAGWLLLFTAQLWLDLNQQHRRREGKSPPSHPSPAESSSLTGAATLSASSYRALLQPWLLSPSSALLVLLNFQSRGFRVVTALNKALGDPTQVTHPVVHQG